MTSVKTFVLIHIRVDLSPVNPVVVRMVWFAPSIIVGAHSHIPRSIWSVVVILYTIHTIISATRVSYRACRSVAPYFVTKHGAS